MTRQNGRTAELPINESSLSGMGLGVEPRIAQLLSGTDRLVMSFSLRGCEDTLRPVGQIRYQRPEGNNFHCGIMFDQQQSSDHLQQEQ